MRTNVYIDGFNLYYGLLRSSPHKWLDLEKWCDQSLPKNAVQKIYYFTAKVDARPHDPDQPIRQSAYLRALGTLPRVEIHYGTFLASVVRQPLVETDPATGRWLTSGNKPALKTDAAGTVITDWVLKSEEKGSDVNLASYLLRDAYQKSCDIAVIISNDSDLLTPINLAKQDCGIKIGLIPPRQKGSLQLKALADFTVSHRAHVLQSSQFPPTLSDAHGTIAKPASW